MMVIGGYKLSKIGGYKLNKRKYAGGYKLSKSQENINHLMYIDDIKLFAKNEKNWKP